MTAPGRVELGTGGVSSGVNIGVDTTFLRAGAVRAKVAQAENRLRSAEAALEAADRNTRLTELEVTRRISTLERKLQMLQSQIKLQDQTRQLYRSQYIELGSREITDLLDAETTLVDRQIELVETRLDLFIAQIDCAARARTLRAALGLEASQLHGFPLSSKEL